MLHTPIASGWRNYCGPTAIASITGRPMSEVKDAIYRERRDRGLVNVNGGNLPVCGMGEEDIVGTMDLLGWDLVESWKWNGDRAELVTLGQFVRDRGSGGPFIVSTSRHWQAIGDNEFCDSITLTPIAVAKAIAPKKRGRKIVQGWLRFSTP